MEQLAILIKVSVLAKVARNFQERHSWSESLIVELLAERSNRDAQASRLTMAMPGEAATVHEKLMTLQAQIRENNAHDLTTGLKEGTVGFILTVAST